MSISFKEGRGCIENIEEEDGEKENLKKLSVTLIQISVPLLFWMEISYFQKEAGKCRGRRK